nr:MAG TPA: hypothetical protein [Herelleviridae sp.]
MASFLFAYSLYKSVRNGHTIASASFAVCFHV